MYMYIRGHQQWRTKEKMCIVYWCIVYLFLYTVSVYCTVRIRNRDCYYWSLHHNSLNPNVGPRSITELLLKFNVTDMLQTDCFSHLASINDELFSRLTFSFVLSLILT